MVWALALAIVSGILALIFGMLMPTLASMPFGQALTIVIAIVLAALLAKKGDIDDYNLFEFVILLAVIALFGTIITAIYPPAAGFILTAGSNFTVSGLIWTFVYLLAGEHVLQMLGLRE